MRDTSQLRVRNDAAHGVARIGAGCASASAVAQDRHAELIGINRSAV
ncbi:hypothetical protein [Variovorax sp. LT1R16]